MLKVQQELIKEQRKYFEILEWLLINDFINMEDEIVKLKDMEKNKRDAKNK